MSESYSRLGRRLSCRSDTAVPSRSPVLVRKPVPLPRDVSDISPEPPATAPSCSPALVFILDGELLGDICRRKKCTGWFVATCGRQTAWLGPASPRRTLNVIALRSSISQAQPGARSCPVLCARSQGVAQNTAMHLPARQPASDICTPSTQQARPRDPFGNRFP